MKVFNLHLSAWLSISLLFCLACNTTAPKTKPIEVGEQSIPKPVMDGRTDSLKLELDAERARRKQQGKE
jgi:hypothetical protein